MKLMLLKGEPVILLIAPQWGPPRPGSKYKTRPKPANCLIQRYYGPIQVRPFRGLRNVREYKTD